MSDCFCTFLPEHVLDHIAKSDDASPVLKQHASRTIEHTQKLKAARKSRHSRLGHGGGGHGGSGGGSGGSIAQPPDEEPKGHDSNFGTPPEPQGHASFGNVGGYGARQAPLGRGSGHDDGHGHGHGHGTFVSSQMLENIAKSKDVPQSTKDAAQRTKAHDDALFSNASQAPQAPAAGKQTISSSQGILGDDDDTNEVIEGDPVSEDAEEKALTEAENQPPEPDTGDYPDDEIEAFDETDEQGFTKVTMSKGPDGMPKLVFETTPDESDAWRVFKATNLKRAVYDGERKTIIPGKLLRNETSEIPRNLSVNRAFDGFGIAYALLLNKFGWDSLDNKGKELRGTVRFGYGYMNAIWDGVQMRFGEGDGSTFKDFTNDVDVLAHEMTHGLIANTCGLSYKYQSGALNEHLADVMGIMTKQMYYNRKVDESKWLIADNIMMKYSRAFRDMRNPGTAYDNPVMGKDNQPAHIKAYDYTEEDNGGVHINSGIPNKAFYLAATAFGGYSWEKAGQIWFKTMTGGSLAKNASFLQFSQATISIAKETFDQSAADVVNQAWNDVGIYPLDKTQE